MSAATDPTTTVAAPPTIAAAASPVAAERRRRGFWNPPLAVGTAILAAMVVFVVVYPIVSPHDPTEPNFAAGTFLGPSREHLLGTDNFGRDILTRLAYGGRIDLSLATVATLITVLVGSAVGLATGYFGGWVDTVIMRVMDVILAFPSLLLALVLVAVLGPGLTNAMIAIALVLQPHFARLTRAAVMGELPREYVMAARVAGAGKLRLMFRTILPNCLGPLIVQATLSFSGAILDAAALGFLGMGAQRPTPEWGTMLAEAREFILAAWWVVTFPGLAILITVLAINLMGDGLRDALDPKLKRS